MKIVKINLFAGLLLMSMAFGCKEDDGPKTETIPITFEFSSSGGLVEGDESCGGPPVRLIYQEGSGTGTLLGNFTFYAEFCSNFETGEYYKAPSKGGSGIFTAANGDELYVEGGGQVVPSDHPDYISEFHDPFTITGGTGRFEGATGGGTTHGFNVEGNPPLTEHEWTGTITLMK